MAATADQLQPKQKMSVSKSSGGHRSPNLQTANSKAKVSFSKLMFLLPLQTFSDQLASAEVRNNNPLKHAALHARIMHFACVCDIFRILCVHLRLSST